MNIMGATQVKSLLILASQLSGYPIPADAQPEVHIASWQEMAREACDSKSDIEVLMCPVLGFYEWPIAGTRPERLWVRADATDDSTNSITVHELTHWLQWHNGFHPIQCPTLFMIEYQAYKAAVAYQITYENKPIPDYFSVPGVDCPLGGNIK